jgi:hypothetical protein
LQQINIFLLASVNLVKDVSTDWIDYPCLWGFLKKLLSKCKNKE